MPPALQGLVMVQENLSRCWVAEEHVVVRVYGPEPCEDMIGHLIPKCTVL